MPLVATRTVQSTQTSRCEDTSQPCEQMCISGLATQAELYNRALLGAEFCSPHQHEARWRWVWSHLSHLHPPLCDLEMLSLNSSCVGTHPKQILQDLAKLAHANYSLMSIGLFFIHREAQGRCCQKRCGQKDLFYKSYKLKVWQN